MLLIIKWSGHIAICAAHLAQAQGRRFVAKTWKRGLLFLVMRGCEKKGPNPVLFLVSLSPVSKHFNIKAQHCHGGYSRGLTQDAGSRPVDPESGKQILSRRLRSRVNLQIQNPNQWNFRHSLIWSHHQSKMQMWNRTDSWLLPVACCNFCLKKLPLVFPGVHRARTISMSPVCLGPTNSSVIWSIWISNASRAFPDSEGCNAKTAPMDHSKGTINMGQSGSRWNFTELIWMLKGAEFLLNRQDFGF